MNKTKAAVLIVGAGPTGLVMALWLTKFGVPVRIIDKNEGPGETSRALVVQARTLEFYNQIGIADDVIAAGIKMEYFSFRKKGRLLKTVKIGDIGVNMTPYSFVLSFPQDDHEKLLLAHLQNLGVTVERHTELLSFTQSAEKIIARLSCQGQEEVAEFTYLCGCDGARSTTREQLDIQFPGATYNKLFFVADVASPDEIMRGLQIGISDMDFCLSFPVRSTKTVRLIGIVPAAHAKKADIQFADVQESVARDTPIKINSVNWFSTYHVHHRVVPKFRLGRVFLAGDAAHIHSPVGGQGMNTGIGDAINLAWKLAAVLQGKCKEKILETYEEERLPFAQKLVSTTDQLFQIVTSPSFLGTLWRGFIFPHLFPFLLQHKFSREHFFKFVSQTKINYRKSALSAKQHGKVRPGDRLPWVQQGIMNNFDALKQLGWQVHVYGKASTLLRKNLQTQNIPLYEFAWSKAAKEKNLKENAAYLIRPDGYISVVDYTADGADIKKMMQSFL